MADTKITQLQPPQVGYPVVPATDVLPIVVIADPGMATSGSTRKVTVNQLLGAGGTATLASATISGDLTVDTSTLKVDSANNRVGVGTASPAETLHVSGGNIRMSINQFLYLYYGSATNYASLGADNSGNVQVFTGLSSPANRFQIANDGVCTWSNVGGFAGTAMTLNSTGLGVGVTPAVGFELQQTSPMARITSTSTTGYSTLTLRNTGASGRTYGITVGGSGTGATAAGNLYISDDTASAIRLTLDSSGNVGVGVTPSAWASGYKAIQGPIGGFALSNDSSNNNQFRLSSNAYFDTTDSRWEYYGSSTATAYEQAAGQHRFFNAVSGTANTAITFTQAMTLDAGGNLLVGVTSDLVSPSRRLSVSGTVAATLQSTGAATVEAVNVWHTAATGDNKFIEFDTEASITARGSITYNRAGGLVAYNTTSDYRAKDIIGPVSNSGSVIDSLKVYIGKMKGATVERPMLVAHEAQEFAPYSVTGQKDEVDADGNPKYQQMDVSSFVPLLIAEIQSLRARVQTLEAK